MREALALALLLVVPALAACLGPAPDDGLDASDAAAARRDPAVWRERLTAPVHDAIESTITYIEAEDGTQLSLTLHLPAGLPTDAKVPTLLQITPYQAGRTWTPLDGTGEPGGEWRDLVVRGAAYVEADARGTNGSGGCLDFGGSADRGDANAFVSWIRAQPWSNGVVVTDGVSHPGMGSVLAHAAVPDLTGAIAVAPVVSYYQDQWLQGARMEQLNEFYQTTESRPATYVDPPALAGQAAPCTGSTLLDFGKVEGRFSETWADRDISRHITEADAPILLVQGFVDMNVHPDHVQLYWDALPDDASKHLLMGWWYHSWADMEGHPFEEYGDMRQRWLDATLFGVDNGQWAEPRVLVEDSEGTWHESDDWPLTPSETLRLHGTGDGALVAGDPQEGHLSYTDRLGADRGRWGDAHVAFRTEPLEADRLVNGAPVAHLVASSSEAATKWVVYLLDEAPDGSWERVSHGYADSHWSTGEGEWEPLTPGEAVAWDIPLFPTAVVVGEGHRLVLVVASQDSALTNGLDDGVCWDDRRGGCYDPTGIVPAGTAGRAVNTVHAGPEGTYVDLAWVDPAATRKPSW